MLDDGDGVVFDFEGEFELFGEDRVPGALEGFDACGFVYAAGGPAEGALVRADACAFDEVVAEECC